MSRRGKASPSALFQSIAKGKTTEFQEQEKFELDQVKETQSDSNVEKEETIEQTIKVPQIVEIKRQITEKKVQSKEGKAKGNERSKITVYYEDDEILEFAKAYSEIQLELRVRSKYKLSEYKFLKLAAKIAIEEFNKDKEKFIKKMVKSVTE